MSHEIWNGKAIYTGNSADVWHGIGIYVGDKKLTSAEIMESTGLDYEVTKIPLMIARPDGSLFPSRNFAVCRDGIDVDPEGLGNPVQLGTVTANYQILQNREAFKMMDPLVEEGLIEYTAAGALLNGARTWLAAKLNNVKIEDTVVREITVGGKKTADTVEAFWLMYNGHDGVTAASTNLTAIRPICFNTVTAALGDASLRTDGKKVGIDALGKPGHAGTKARHGGNVVANVQAAVKTLEATHAEFGNLMTAYRKMATVKFTDAKIAKFFKMVFPLADDAEYSTRRANQIAEMTRLAIEGVGNTGGTFFDLFNGVTEWIDHKASTDEMANVNSSWFGSRKDQRQAAFNAAMKMVA